MLEDFFQVVYSVVAYIKVTRATAEITALTLRRPQFIEKIC